MSDGRKDDAGKARWDLLPWAQVAQVVDVLTHGAQKYGDHNWQMVTDPHRRYMAALMRHVSAYAQGEAVDRESGRRHLAHAVCCALFLMWHEED